MKNRFLYFSALLLSLTFLTIVVFWSFDAADKQEEVEVKVETKQPSLVLPVSIQNASYSAVPLIRDSITAQKGLPNDYVTQKGNNLLVLVNKTISLPSTYYPSDLISLEGLVVAYKGALLRAEAASQLSQMFKAAKKAGYNLTVTSAYRSYAAQQATFNYWVSTAGLVAASQISARPGHSQHQLGTAVDLSSTSVKNNLSPDFGNTPEGKWLAANSYRWGYVLSYPAGKENVTGYSYEPWHFRYIGVTSAKQMHNLGFDLETFLRNWGVW